MAPEHGVRGRPNAPAPLCGTCEQCGGGAGGKCPHGHYRHARCFRCAHEAIDRALAHLSTGTEITDAIDALEEARHAHA